MIATDNREIAKEARLIKDEVNQIQLSKLGYIFKKLWDFVVFIAILYILAIVIHSIATA